MDIYCSKCGEPWDLDTIHEVAEEDGSTFDKIRKAFYRDGCRALGSHCGTPSTETDRSYGLTRQDAAAALYDLLDDDIDGAAAMLEDMGY